MRINKLDFIDSFTCIYSSTSKYLFWNACWMLFGGEAICGRWHVCTIILMIFKGESDLFIIHKTHDPGENCWTESYRYRSILELFYWFECQKRVNIASKWMANCCKYFHEPEFEPELKLQIWCTTNESVSLTSMLYDFLIANNSRFFWAAATAIIFVCIFFFTLLCLSVWNCWSFKMQFKSPIQIVVHLHLNKLQRVFTLFDCRLFENLLFLREFVV